MNTLAVKQWGQGNATEREAGSGLIEYVLLVALIAVVVIGAIAFFGGSVTTIFSSSGSTLSGSM